MAAPAFVPRLFGAGMVSGLLLAVLVAVTGPDSQPAEAHVEFGSWKLPAQSQAYALAEPPAWVGPIAPSKDAVAPPWAADARDWPHGMVMGRHASPVDRMDAEVLAHWLSGFFSWLASHAA